MRQLRRPPPPATLQALHVPAPVGGINTLAGGTAMPPTDCIKLYNMVSGQHGLRARQGYKVFNTAGSGPVRTVLPYKGRAVDGSSDKVFAVTGLIDGTAGGIQDMTPGNNGLATRAWQLASDSFLADPSLGRGISTTFTTSAGQFLLYCDEAGGYFVYDESIAFPTPQWNAVTLGAGANQILGANPANFCFVMSWKSRLWFVEKNSNRIWYLPAGQIYGTVTQLALAQSAQLRQGGDVIGLWNWTLDGGIGLDDHLVAATRGGDVAIYQGTDPASASAFSLRGTWTAGAFVAGRRCVSNFGGDLLLLTKSGIRPLSQLVSGGDGNQTYVTAKIANLFNELAASRGDLPGWDMCVHPDEGALVVTVPRSISSGTGDYASDQLVMSLWNRSWSYFRDLPISAMGVWKGKLYFGTGAFDAVGASYLWVSDGYVDADKTSISGTAGIPIQWAVLTAFSDLGSPQQKQVQWIRPTLLANAYPPTYSAEARYNFDLSELASVTEVAGSTGNLFDVATWDAGVFTDDPQPSRAVRGTTGFGSLVALAIRGTARSRTTLVGIDVGYTRGGFL